MRALTRWMVSVVALATVMPASALARGSVATRICSDAVQGIVCPASHARPRTMVLGADGRTMLLGLRWAHWGDRMAHARGTLRSNAAAAGARPHYLRYRASVVASGRIRCRSVYVYTRLEVKVPGQSSGLPTTLTYASCSSAG